MAWRKTYLATKFRRLLNNLRTVYCLPSKMQIRELGKRSSESNVERDDSAVPLEGRRAKLTRVRELDESESLAPCSSEVDNDKDDYKKQHTLDSDEEEEQKYEKMNIQSIAGQEDKTIDFDEQTKITPFNMREEMDEGHFDSEGTFIFKQNKEEIKDAWLDNIDWSKVKTDAGTLWDKENATEENSVVFSNVEKLSIYKQMLNIVQPKETVAKAIKRLGGDKNSIEMRRRKWKSKGDKEIDQESIDKMVQLTELVDQLVSNGLFDAYEFSFEKIQYQLKLLDEQSARSSSSMDMFADNVDEASLQTTSASKIEKSFNHDEDQTTMWQYKWEEGENAPLHGPFSSTQMKAWTDQGYFDKGVLVRKAASADSNFYSSKRIDFDLYT